MTTFAPVLDAPAVQGIIRSGLPSAGRFDVLAIAPGAARTRIRVDDSMQRPGGTVSGPTLFTAGDAAMYAVILAHIGDRALAVTTDASIHFLKRPALVDVLADARLLKLGKRLAVCAVDIRSDGDDALIAHMTGTYSLPPKASM